MAQELIYTSASRGLRLGSSGFCTVACTRGMAANYVELLESLSGYSFVYPPHHERAHLNPTAYSHYLLSPGGKQVSILSRVAFAGVDYTQRSNKLAWHLVLDPSERAPAGPAWVQMQKDLLPDSWEGEPGYLERERSIPRGESEVRICSTWRHVMEDAGWAGVLAQSYLSSPDKPAFLIFDPDRPHLQVLQLLSEALALLPGHRRWKVTYNTYFTKMPFGATCAWRCCLAGSPAGSQVGRTPGLLCLDLTRGGDQAPEARRLLDRGSPLVKAARTGNVPQEAAEAPRMVARQAAGAAVCQATPPVEGSAKTGGPDVAPSWETAETVEVPAPTDWRQNLPPIEKTPQPRKGLLILWSVAVACVLAFLALALLVRKPDTPEVALSSYEDDRPPEPPKGLDVSAVPDAPSKGLPDSGELSGKIEALADQAEKEKQDSRPPEDVAEKPAPSTAVDSPKQPKVETREEDKARLKRDRLAKAFAENSAFHILTKEWGSLPSKIHIANKAVLSDWPALSGLTDGWRVRRCNIREPFRARLHDGGLVVRALDIGSRQMTDSVVATPQEGGITFEPVVWARQQYTQSLEAVEWLELSYETADGEDLHVALIAKPLQREVQLDDDLRGHVAVPGFLKEAMDEDQFPIELTDMAGFKARLRATLRGEDLDVVVEYDALSGKPAQLKPQPAADDATEEGVEQAAEVNSGGELRRQRKRLEEVQDKLRGLKTQANRLIQDKGKVRRDIERAARKAWDDVVDAIDDRDREAILGAVTARYNNAKASGNLREDVWSAKRRIARSVLSNQLQMIEQGVGKTGRFHREAARRKPRYVRYTEKLNRVTDRFHNQTRNARRCIRRTEARLGELETRIEELAQEQGRLTELVDGARKYQEELAKRDKVRGMFKDAAPIRHKDQTVLVLDLKPPRSE